MNILICSVGRRVKLIEFFKEELNKVGGKVIAVDCDSTAPALHFADAYEIVPRITHPEYIQQLIYLCKEYQVSAVLSLIDPELSLLANYKKEFEKEGVKVIVSDKEVVDICFDKFLTAHFLNENGIPSIPTYLEIDEVIQDLENDKIQFPLIVKPKNGSASLGIHKVSSLEELRVLQREFNGLIVQPFIEGEEFGVDCYIDLISKETSNIFIKKKISMRAGETDKSVSVIDPHLTMIIEKLVTTLEPIGPIDIDCFRTKKGYVVSEINPRFGGGYLHAHGMGENFVSNIIRNLKGRTNGVRRNEYKEGTKMIKYDHFQLL